MTRDDQGLDSLLAHLVADTFAATCADGERDYLDGADVMAIATAAMVAPDLVVAACHRGNIPVCP